MIKPRGKTQSTLLSPPFFATLCLFFLPCSVFPQNICISFFWKLIGPQKSMYTGRKGASPYWKWINHWIWILGCCVISNYLTKCYHLLLLCYHLLGWLSLASASARKASLQTSGVTCASISIGYSSHTTSLYSHLVSEPCEDIQMSEKMICSDWHQIDMEEELASQLI